MRFATAATAAVVGATAAVAQLPLPTSGSSGNLASQALSVFGQLSPQCQSTVYGLLSSPVVECLNIPQSVNVLITTFSNTNASIIAPIDQLLAIDCNSSGCSNSTLQSFAQNITTGCGTDLAKYNISSSLVDTVVEQYPLAREVVCLRTSDYNSTTSSNDSTIPITSPPYNITNGTAFCATSLLTEVSQKVGSNLTIPFFVDLYDAYKNNSLTQFTSKFNFSTTDICNECIFAAADVIGVAYPQVGNLTLAEIGFNSTSVSNVTLSQALDGQCAAYNLTWNSNGTLPANVTSGAVNSTFGFNLTSAANSTNSTSSSVAKRNVVDIKARWVGQI